jgi:glyoxylase-like metal-dependent hydrolase (beta-lactamase superfamily II)
MALDFFVWLVRGPGCLLLVDTGFSAVSALARGRRFLVPPLQSLQALGVEAGQITDLAITHLHYDHAGNVGQFPTARIWLQEREMQYATGRCMCEGGASHFFAVDDIAVVLGRLHAGQVRLIDGFHEIAPGIQLHRVGGHTDGLQVVRVHTRRGWIVLASDAAHYYENLSRRNPFPAIHSRPDMERGYALIESLADGESHIIPGHDPLVCQRFERVGQGDSQVFRIA